MSKKTVTGRTPSKPELQVLMGKVANKQAEFYAAAFSGRFPANGENTTNDPRSVLIDMPYSETEQRVAAMSPAFAAPYGQEEKTND